MKGATRWQLDRQLEESHRIDVIANDYARLGDKDNAFQWLEKSWSRPLFGFKHAPSNPQMDPLRCDPRFEELLRKQKLPEEAIRRHLVLK